MNLDERLQKDLSPDIYCLVHNKMINLEQQVKKQKEVINKIQMVVIDMQTELMKLQPYHSYVIDGNKVRNFTEDFEDILKEVSDE